MRETSRLAFEKEGVTITQLTIYGKVWTLKPEVCCHQGHAFGEYPEHCGKAKWKPFELLGLTIELEME